SFVIKRSSPPFEVKVEVPAFGSRSTVFLNLPPIKISSFVSNSISTISTILVEPNVFTQIKFPSVSSFKRNPSGEEPPLVENNSKEVFGSGSKSAYTKLPPIYTFPALSTSIDLESSLTFAPAGLLTCFAQTKSPLLSNFMIKQSRLKKGEGWLNWYTPGPGSASKD